MMPSPSTHWSSVFFPFPVALAPLMVDDVGCTAALVESYGSGSPPPCAVPSTRVASVTNSSIRASYLHLEKSTH